jgi:hypothetical protein
VSDGAEVSEEVFTGKASLTTVRQLGLLIKAARCMEKGESPFDTSFLQEHRVTLDEVYDMADQMSLAVWCFLDLIEELKGGGLPSQVAAHRLAAAIMTNEAR